MMRFDCSKNCPGAVSDELLTCDIRSMPNHLLHINQCCCNSKYWIDEHNYLIISLRLFFSDLIEFCLEFFFVIVVLIRFEIWASKDPTDGAGMVKSRRRVAKPLAGGKIQI